MPFNVVFGRLGRGCRECLLGVKSVLFITGVCPLNCFYCPVSRERFGRDVMFINDRPVVNYPGDIIDEIDRVGGHGLAITGGDPVMVVDRVVEVVRLLKGIYGEGFHIHMYTHVLNLNKRAVDLLGSSGIDEIRIHAINKGQLMGRLDLVRALSKSVDLGLEVPALPGFEDNILGVVEVLAGEGLIGFVNINELDVSPANIDKLVGMGYRVNPGGFVEGSFEVGVKLAGEIRRRWPWLNVNVCTSKSKDIAQIGSRLFRYNMRISGGGEYVLDDGTVEERLSGRIRLRIGGRDYVVEDR
ncbi:radical SAM protein [Vulcanisaeta thermophila]|uniref:radical SAM protein n=1 Tax=Vulcanisaeta thermophila TaxID=867917 RepID=UPI000853C2D0|nr:radical SAM protein [Vulcanisaeta thermophila]